MSAEEYFSQLWWSEVHIRYHTEQMGGFMQHVVVESFNHRKVSDGGGKNLLTPGTPPWAWFMVIVSGIPPILMLTSLYYSTKSKGVAVRVAAPSFEVSTAEEGLDTELVGTKEHRRYRRMAMKTRVRIRRESGSEMEVLEPVNVSQGGIGFESTRQYDPREVVWVKMPYDPSLPDSGGIETRSLIVRAVPLPGWNAFSCGVQFLTA